MYSYLPFLYSCVSFVGVLLLLLCTPLGFARLFALVGDLVIKPNFMRNLDEEFYTAKFEEDCLRQRLVECRKKHGRYTKSPIIRHVDDLRIVLLKLQSFGTSGRSFRVPSATSLLSRCCGPRCLAILRKESARAWRSASRPGPGPENSSLAQDPGLPLGVTGITHSDHRVSDLCHLKRHANHRRLSHLA